jgi:hypothetical protein
MIKKYFILMVMVCTIAIPLRATDFEWTFEEAYDERFLYLHPLVNYNFNAQWQYDWERNLFKGQGFSLSVGSVTTHDLLVDGSLVLNQPLGEGWHFRGEGRWLETRHHTNIQQTTYMGLTKQIIGNNSIYMLVNPAYNKEYTDLNMGIMFSDSSYENYLRLGIVWEDFVYDDKKVFYFNGYGMYHCHPA